MSDERAMSPILHDFVGVYTHTEGNTLHARHDNNFAGGKLLNKMKQLIILNTL